MTKPNLFTICCCLVMVAGCSRPAHGPLSGKNPNSIDGGYYKTIAVAYLCEEGTECGKGKHIVPSGTFRVSKERTRILMDFECINPASVQPQEGSKTDLYIEGIKVGGPYPTKSHGKCFSLVFDTKGDVINFCKKLPDPQECLNVVK